MKKTTSLLAALGVFAVSASFASSSDVVTLHFNMPSMQGHYLKANYNGNEASTECISNGVTMSITNDDIGVALTLHVLKLGSNHITFTQCNNRLCTQTGKQVAADFGLSQSGQTYSASPSDITLNFDAFGETCTPGLKGHRRSFLLG
jgi:hypothetical protein